MRQKVSVVILTLNREEFLQKCLDSIFAQDFDAFEVLVIDGGSRDGTLDLARSYRVSLQFEPNGIIKSYNKGLKEAHGDIVVFVDDDIVAAPDLMKRVVRIFDADGRIAGVGGRVLGMEDKVSRLRRLGGIYDALFYEKDKTTAIGKICKSGVTTSNFNIDSGYPIVVDYILGCNMAFRKQLVKSVGGFDENYEPLGYFFEPDICIRLRREGYRIVFEPSAIVYHNLAQTGTGGTRRFLLPSMRVRGLFHEHKTIVYFFLKNYSGSLVSILSFILKQTLDSAVALYSSAFRGSKLQVWEVIGKMAGVVKFLQVQIDGLREQRKPA